MLMFKKSLMIIVVCFIFIFSSIGFAVDNPRVGVTLREHFEYWLLMDKGIRDVGKSADAEVFTEYEAQNLARQLSSVENFIQKRINLLITCPLTDVAIGSIELANEAGVSVILVDTKLDPSVSDKVDYISYVGSNDRIAGKVCAEFVAEKLGGKGNVVILDFPEVTPCARRTEAFLEVLEEYPDIKVVAQQSASGMKENAMNIMQSILQANKKIDAVWGINDGTVLGAMAAVDAAGRADEVIFTMVSGGDKQTFELLKEGKSNLLAAGLVFPYKIGAAAMKLGLMHLQGKEVPKEVSVPAKLITHENIDEILIEWDSLTENWWENLLNNQ